MGKQSPKQKNHSSIKSKVMGLGIHSHKKYPDQFRRLMRRKFRRQKQEPDIRSPEKEKPPASVQADPSPLLLETRPMIFFQAPTGQFEIDTTRGAVVTYESSDEEDEGSAVFPQDTTVDTLTRSLGSVTLKDLAKKDEPFTATPPSP